MNNYILSYNVCILTVIFVKGAYAVIYRNFVCDRRTNILNI